MNHLDLLKASRARISDPTRWTKDTQARAQNGEPVFGSDPLAVCWSGYGALYAEPGVPSITQAHARSLLQEMMVRRAGAHASLTLWHDRNETTLADVVDLFTATIEAVERGEL